MMEMRRGFTMIELIFVIVIIGILAAVAIPKLAATRDDARISNIVTNARVALGDMTSFYTSQGPSTWGNTDTLISTVTNVPFDSACGVTSTDAVQDNDFLLCDEADGTACLTFTTTASEVTITTNNTSGICEAVVNDPAIIGMIKAAQRLGGRAVSR